MPLVCASLGFKKKWGGDAGAANCSAAPYLATPLITVSRHLDLKSPFVKAVACFSKLNSVYVCSLQCTYKLMLRLSLYGQLLQACVSNFVCRITAVSESSGTP